ncbi:MAG: hypothetical protein OQK50_00540 [Deltaproteobacteria bacterium]|jgi:hypothetical protein|nr:hypothetical protein [Deltaproteobacteria bacterium]MCW8893948.1 hypothetical protein [Deltaproteobacteria bacterium]MCW9048799.1 hypothetical protein [Deltaproteobacteria bacterium]
MNTTVTVNYDSLNSIKNAVDDLLGVGIPQEKFYVIKSAKQIKVITPKASEPEILELLNRHNPV